jgi:hypothetical protein
MKKAFDMVVAVGQYTTRNGEVKKKYENIGSVMQGDNGLFILMKRTFNPAGVPNPENRESLMVSLFAPKDEQKPNETVVDNPFSDDNGTPF